MYIIASFQHSTYLELAINDLELSGVPKESIFAVPLVPKLGQTEIFDTIHRSDGISLMDAPALLGTFISVIGAIYGFVLKWGPIIWGLIGLVLGMTLGFCLELILNKRKLKRKKLKNKDVTEVVLMINCEEHQAETIGKILYHRNASGVAKLRQ